VANFEGLHSFENNRNVSIPEIWKDGFENNAQLSRPPCAADFKHCI